MNDYIKMTQVIHYLVKNCQNQPSLSQISQVAGLSPHHLQRKFKAWIGVSPKAFLQHLTYIEAKSNLLNGDEITKAAFNTGLSVPGRLYDLCIKLEAASPGEIKKLGQGFEIHYGFGPTPFGKGLIGISPRGICYLTFVHQLSEHRAISELKKTWPKAKLKIDQDLAMVNLKKIFSFNNNAKGLDAFVTGTEFQLKVWRALLNIPSGKVVSYGTLAKAIGNDGAARAVGSAIAGNYLAYLIPCHRVIRSNGATGEYRWGNSLKKKMIAIESSINST